MKLSKRIPDILLDPERLYTLKDEVAQLEADNAELKRENEGLRDAYIETLLWMKDTTRIWGMAGDEASEEIFAKAPALLTAEEQE